MADAVVDKNWHPDDGHAHPDIVTLGDVTELTFCRAGRRARTRLEHPLAEAIVEGAKARGAGKRQQILGNTGKGVRDRSARTVALGNTAMMQEMGLDT
jgi:Cu+-exporting ATPase